MARARPAAPPPGQLTLDDWAEVAGADRKASDSKRRRQAKLAATRQATIASSVQPSPPDVAAPRPAEPAGRPSRTARELLALPEALLTRTHLRELGLERRAVDAIFRALPVVELPGYSRPMIRVEDYVQLVHEHTYLDDRVRPCHA